jgi:hypothetical protein
MQKRVEEFDYLNSNLSEQFNQKISVRSMEMFELEVKERTRLLFNLRYPEDKAVARIRNNIEWEFDHSWNANDPAVLDRVATIVKDYYKYMQGKLD